MALPLFSSALAEETAVQSGQLETTIRNFRQNSQTGLVELNPHKTNQYALLFARGQLVNVYACKERAERLTPETWSHLSSQLTGEFSLRSLVLTPQAIRLVKIFIEQIGTGPASPVNSQGLETLIGTWSALPESALVHIRWPSADALTLLPGSNDPPRHTLFIASDQILHSAGGMMALYGWQEKNCQVTLYSSDLRTAAWEEYFLHTGFAWVVGHILSRFEELTGRLLLNSIMRDLNFAATNHGWSISIAPSGVTDQMVFASPEAAAQVYQWLFSAILGRVEGMLGSDLLAVLVRESLMRMHGSPREIFHKHISISTEYAPIVTKKD